MPVKSNMQLVDGIQMIKRGSVLENGKNVYAFLYDLDSSKEIMALNNQILVPRTIFRHRKIRGTAGNPSGKASTSIIPVHDEEVWKNLTYRSKDFTYTIDFVTGPRGFNRSDGWLHTIQHLELSYYKPGFIESLFYSYDKISSHFDPNQTKKLNSLTVHFGFHTYKGTELSIFK